MDKLLIIIKKYDSGRQGGENYLPRETFKVQIINLIKLK